MIGLALKSTTALLSLTAIIDYYRHGKLWNDGIAPVASKDYVTDIEADKIPDMVDKGFEYLKIARLSYKPRSTGIYDLLERVDNRLRTSIGLEASAYKDRETGKVYISIAGLEFGGSDGMMDTIHDLYTVFKTSAGARSYQLDELVKFASKIAEKHGPISGIAGHSLGGYLGMQLKVVGDKKGILTPDCELHRYDSPGMTNTLAIELRRRDGITQADITHSLKNDRVFSWINDSNCFNSHGHQPGVFLTATSPEQSSYLPHQLKNFVPMRHTIPEFMQSFRVGNGEFFPAKAETYSRVPWNITFMAAGGLLGFMRPECYLICAEFVLAAGAKELLRVANDNWQSFCTSRNSNNGQKSSNGRE